MFFPDNAPKIIKDDGGKMLREFKKTCEIHRKFWCNRTRAEFQLPTSTVGLLLIKLSRRVSIYLYYCHVRLSVSRILLSYIWSSILIGGILKLKSFIWFTPSRLHDIASNGRKIPHIYILNKKFCHFLIHSDRNYLE